MNPKTTYTTEQREKVLDFYKSGMLYEEITYKTGVGRGTITNWAKQAGLALRHPKKCKEYKPKKCFFCGEVLDGKFRFCPYCGKDVREKKDIIIEHLTELFGIIQVLPEHKRDRVRDIINETKEYIKDGK